MKLPKKVIIAGAEWTVKTNKTHNGGSCKGLKVTIEIGTKNKEYIPEIFLHEVLESILMMKNFRSKRFDNDENYRFMFTHDEFCLIVQDLAVALKDVLK